MDYVQPIPLSGDVLKQRIFSPLAYATIRNANVMAIAPVEAARFAGHYPIAWRKQNDSFELVVVRSLLADGRGHAPGTQTTLAFIPVLARCYPFLYDPALPPQAGKPKFVDTAIADQPNDIGAPIALADGRPSKATLQRIAQLDAAAPSFALSATIAATLAKAELFEPWPLHFENIEGQTLDVDGLWIVRQNVVETGGLAPLLRAHGIAAADLVSLHRISLYRAGMLLAQSRAALKIEAAANVQSLVQADQPAFLAEPADAGAAS